MELIEVTTPQLEDIFIETGYLINKDFPNYIRPIDKEVKEVFDKAKNKFYKDGGEAIRWILVKDGKHIGRIAAYVYPRYKNKGTDYPVGCVGFFDCINDQAAAGMLFDAAKYWLKSKKVDAMDGPVNFGDRDKWWGLLVEGFDEPIYGLAFNPPYYQRLFEDYGFMNYYNQYYYGLNIDDELSDKFVERYNRLKSKKGYEARHINKHNLEKHAQEFAKVYNEAWSQHDEGKEISPQQVLKLFNQLKPVIDEKIIWFAYYNDEPIAMWINIPDINQYFKHFNGKIGLWQKIKFLWMKLHKTCDKFIGIAFGVVPRFQGMGVDSFMIYEGSRYIVERKLYKTYEMGWSGDWNPRMLSVYKSLNAVMTRKLITYRYIFDNKHPFERHPPVEK